MGKSCRWVVPSALYQPSTCALYILHLHNPSIVLQTLYNAAIAYSAQPPPTVGEIEGAKEGEGIPQTQKRSPVQTFTWGLQDDKMGKYAQIHIM